MHPSSLLCLLVLLPQATPAQTKTHHPATAPEKQPTQLPVTRVALYKNGVGFFEHSGRVQNDQSVTIDFTTSQLNDVLQSLTAVDLQGGRITGAGYNSTTPLDQQLKSLPLALGADATQADFYNAIRGARVTVAGAGAPITGRLLSMQSRETQPSNNNLPAIERQFLTVVSESGQVRTLELTPTVSVTLLDTTLHTDVTRYLELLASTRNSGLRHLTLEDRGTGPRDLKVSYISEVPVWKSTYRILVTDDKSTTKSAESATLQGWSVVDNTTGSDWLNVHLSLIAGAPQSFIQPLSTPYYTRRPEIPLPTEAQLTPQTHESGDEEKSAAAPGMSGGAAGGVLGGTPHSSNQSLNVTADNSALAAPLNGRQFDRFSGGALAQDMVSGNVIGPAHLGGGYVPPPPAPYQALAEQSLTPQTTTAAFDDFFEYSLTDPITIRKNESALVPILQTKLPIERVTLWSPRQPTALRALWITNNSTFTLDRGSFSIVEDGNFGGEGLLDPIHPAERRLLSYAADQAVRVSESGRNYSSHVQHLVIAKGVLTETSLEIRELTYDIRNAAADPRSVVIEHPIRPGFTIDSAGGKSTDPKPTETTPTIARFKLSAAPGETVHLHVGERRTNSQFIRLVDRTEDQLILLFRNAHASAATLAALQPVFDAHHTVVALDAQIAARTAEIGSINADQSRLRENMKALKGSPEEKALLSRYTGELNAQEDRLAAINRELATLHSQRETADQDFQTKLEAVHIDETL